MSSSALPLSDDLLTALTRAHSELSTALIDAIQHDHCITLTLAAPLLGQQTAYQQTLNQWTTANQQPPLVLQLIMDIPVLDKSSKRPVPGVKNIIAIASGKGGVGKSTVSVNLAKSLQLQGAKVGILDADVFGPSLPTMLGNQDKPAIEDGKFFIPLQAHGIQMLSVGSLVPSDDTPMIWRGPVVTGTLRQLLHDTHWGEVDASGHRVALDYLLIDLPPGTGDVQLTLAQEVPVTAAILVTTPQDIALLDAKKAYQMFEKVHIPTLGVVENMSHYICPQCGHEADIFGHTSAEKLHDQYGLTTLARLPLEADVRLGADQGTPMVVKYPQHSVSQLYQKLAQDVGLACLVLEQSSLPEVVMPNHS